MYQFFVEPEQIRDKTVVITGTDVNHIKNVLRMRVGEEIAVSNGADQKEYRCGIAAFTEDNVICELRFVKEDGLELPSKVYLFQGLPKSDKMELIIQKAVELGVYEIIPMSTERVIVKLDEKKKRSRLQRWQEIAKAAAKQSKRRIIPRIRELMSMREAIAYAKEMDVKWIPYEMAENMQQTKQKLEALKEGQSIAVFIGPEGGFDSGEMKDAMEAGIEPITLGRRILRTETAGFTTLAWIMYRLEK